MASSRHNMRRSRRTSPTDTSSPKNLSLKNGAQLQIDTEDLSEEWTEPPLRAPVPSFEDYKGLERHGVLEHMAPLGSLPNSKVRARLKQHEPPRRATHLKNGEPRGPKDEVSTPEPAPPVAARRSEPRKTEERATKVSSSREGDDDHDYTPTLKGSTRAVLAKPASAHPLPPRPVSSRTAQGRLKLKQIVDTAVARATELRDPILGNAVRELYTESLHNPTVADLLDAVLTQKPSPAQTAEFQSRIKAARKKYRERQVSQNPSSKAVSNSPSAKSARSSVTRHFDQPKNLSTPPILNSIPSETNHQSAEHMPNLMGANGSPSKDERSPKRIKRSKSTSSDSSLLSSLDSAIDDEELPPTMKPSAITISNNASNRQVPQSKAQSSNGPKLGTFPLRPTDPLARRPIPSHASPNPPPEDAAAKKREEFRLMYNQILGASQESAIRGSPSPLYSPHSNLPISTFTERYQKGKLRNGASQRRGRDDYETLDSPGSSGFGELLIPPPPPGASRAATPNQLGHPPKGPKKAARIKMSPMKKPKSTTAGRGVEGESSATTNGRTDNNQSDGNSDVCTACSGDGVLICCEGCTRAFHLTCIEPPVNSAPIGLWHCNKCTEDRDAQPSPPSGLYKALLSDSNKQNPISYSLPQPIRDYFEGVKTGEDGEYEEVSIVKAKTTQTRGGYEEQPNNFRLKDAKEGTILCFRCSGSSLCRNRDNADIGALHGQAYREMVQCDHCSLSWHLDCLDPPLAVAPKKSKNNRAKATWMCPNHIDFELNNIGPNVNASNKASRSNGRKYKIRRPKVVSIVDIALRRGFKNNGLIEIENESSDEENSTVKPSGQILRVPETGIKLDFIDRIKRANEEAAHNARIEAMKRPLARPITKVRSPAAESFEKRPFLERRAALNLIQLARSNETSISPDKVENLIRTLVAEAPEYVGQLMTAEDNKAEITEEERADLEAFIELARRRLAGGKAM